MGNIMGEFTKALDQAYPDVIEVRKAFLQYRERYPALLDSLKKEFGLWLDKRFKGA